VEKDVIKLGERVAHVRVAIDRAEGIGRPPSARDVDEEIALRL
jgi:hypothetical protein